MSFAGQETPTPVAMESKWGTGHIWQHGVYEVPDCYGDTVRFFRPFSREMALQALLDFYPGARIEKVGDVP